MKTNHVTVGEVIHDKVDIFTGIATLDQVVTQLKHPENGCFIVAKKNEFDEFAMVTLADIGRKVLAPNKAIERVHVYEIMTKPILSIAPNMHIRYCARLFDRFNIARAPVVDNGAVVGIVTYNHLVLRGYALFSTTPAQTTTNPD